MGIPIEITHSPRFLIHCTTLPVSSTFHPVNTVSQIRDQRQKSNTKGIFVQQPFTLVLTIPLTHQEHHACVNTATCYNQSYVTQIQRNDILPFVKRVNSQRSSQQFTSYALDVQYVHSSFKTRSCNDRMRYMQQSYQALQYRYISLRITQHP